MRKEDYSGLIFLNYPKRRVKKMHQASQDLFHHLSEKFIGYLPDLMGGIALILIGWFLGWFIRRLMIQVMVILRVEQLLVRFTKTYFSAVE
jgi:hypothetical protein